MSKSHASVAYRARLEKEKHPEDYCAVRGCLWRVKHPHGRPDTPCRKHGRKLVQVYRIVQRHGFTKRYWCDDWSWGPKADARRYTSEQAAVAYVPIGGAWEIDYESAGP